MTGSEGQMYEHPTQKCPLYTSGKIVYRCRNAAWSLIKERCVPDAPKDFSYASVDNEWLINKAIVTLTPSVKCYECKFLLKKESGQVNPPVLPAGITLDALAHLADLRVGQGLVPAKQKCARRFPLLQVRHSQGGQPDCAVTALRFGVLDLRLVSGGMGHGPPDMDCHAIAINIFGSQPQHFFQAERVEGL